MARGLIAGLVLVCACAPPPAPPATPRATPPKAAGVLEAARAAPASVPTANATVAHQLVPSGTVAEQWVAGQVTDDRREQLVLVAREAASDSEELSARGAERCSCSIGPTTSRFR